MSTDTNDIPKTIAGIDTLYYFYETNDSYDDLYLDILNQIDETKSKFEKKYLNYENKDIRIAINNQSFIFNGKAQGFYWFSQIDGYLKISFKDYTTNKGLNDIQVQFSAVGIYTLGLKALIKYTDDLLTGFITGHKPLTRVDLNIFIQSDLSWIDKSMFVARKRSYISIFKEIASKHKLETIYVGKKPFLLRIYNKRVELENSNKKEMMFEYFLTNGITPLKDIFNIEFEMHRDYFKSFQIDTVDDLLSRAELLFKDCLSAIRLVDLSTIKDSTLNSKNKNRATTHKLWQDINNSYKLKDFLSIDSPLEKIKRKSYLYTIEKAMQEQLTLARKAYVHNIIIDEQFYSEVLSVFNKFTTYKIITKKEFDTLYKKRVLKPAELNDLDLERYMKRLELDMSDDTFSQKGLESIIDNFVTASSELKKRGIYYEEKTVF